MELRNLLTKGAILLDVEAKTWENRMKLINIPKITFFIFRLDDIADLVLDHCVNNNIVKDDVRVLIKDAIMRKKHHQYQQGHKKDKNGEKSLIRSLTENSFTGSKSK